MSSTEGRESPPPETQTGSQLKSPPGSGHGLGDTTSVPKNPEDQLKNLTSNPKGPLEDAVKEKFAKTKNPPS